MPVIRCVMLACLIVLSGCETAAQRRAEEAAQAQREVAQEIERICSLPEGEREAELEKLKNEEGLVLFCGR